MKFAFRLMVTHDSQTGEILAVYLRIRKGKAVEVKEFANGAAFANYGRKGELLGIEMLAPCSLKVLDRIANSEPLSRKFIRESVPRHMVASA